MGTLWDAVISAFQAFVQNIGWFVGELVNTAGSLNALLPLFAIGIAISLVMVSVKIVRKLTWGA